MSEVTITIDTLNPVEFFGVNDANLDVLRKKFPELKLISRGSEIKVIGDEKNIHRFSEKIARLIEHYQKFGSLTPDNVEHFFSGVKKEDEEKEPIQTSNDVLVYGQGGIMVRARTTNQRRMVESSETNDVVFAIGPAGTGKTYTAVALAVRALKNREIRRIVLTRPAVEAGENLGFLPGDLREKIDPYLRPLYDALYDMLQLEKVKTYIDSGIIEIAPLAFMRGRTLDNAFVILDEAQNATHNQLKMFLTRMGPSAKFIVTGDITQIDLPAHQPSGLIEATKLLKGVKGIDFVHLDAQDVVRHRLVRDIIEAYNKK
ncbi:MAG: PhoH family protein [Bacteroidia bacterium]|nr:PhoH family protein [Bacteroidia bacterium]